MTTLQSIILKLSANTELPLVFEHNGQSIQENYHVTEIKQAHVRSLDCGRGESEWHESIIQLLNGPDSKHSESSYMSAGKFINIMSAASRALPKPKDEHLFFEYSATNASLEKLTLKELQIINGQWIANLSSTPAVCKPAFRSSTQVADKKNAACCGSAP